MIVEYRTDEVVIGGDKRNYVVFDTLHGKDGSILIGDILFKGSLPQCKAYVDGFLKAKEFYVHD